MFVLIIYISQISLNLWIICYLCYLYHSKRHYLSVTSAVYASLEQIAEWISFSCQISSKHSQLSVVTSPTHLQMTYRIVYLVKRSVTGCVLIIIEDVGNWWYLELIGVTKGLRYFILLRQMAEPILKHFPKQVPVY